MTLNLDFGGPLGEPQSGCTWNLGVLNILNEDYRVHGSGFDAPGFGVIVGLRLSY